MKRNRLLARVAATLALMMAPAGAADAGTGTIQGRVQNSRTGEYVERARLQMPGMNLETFTDEGGFYRFTQVPAGEASIEAFFTGLPAAVVRVTVTPGAVVERDIMVGGGDPAAPVKLAEFVVDVSREMAASAIAINEQRFAPNIKNVVSTDEFGYVPEGNAADFLKFLPGIAIDVVGGNSREVSINGAPAENVPITLDGFNMASSGVGNVNTTRTVAMDMFSVNNVARIEVEYTPTPESQGSALAGSVNMVPRSAFERSRPVLNVSAFVMMRSNEHSFRKTPGPRQSPSRKFDPGFDFAYVMPVNNRFGFTVSGGTSTNFSAEPMTQTVWRGASAATNGAAFPHTAPDQPYLTSFTYRDGTKVSTRNSIGTAFDFKFTRNDRLSLGFQYNYFHLYGTNQNMMFVINRVLPGDFGVHATRSAPGQAQLQPGNLMRDRHNRTAMPTLVWRHDGPVWKGDLGLGVSISTNANRDIDKGAFVSTTGFRRNLTIAFEDMVEMRPRVITVTDANGVPVDPFAITGKTFNTATAQQNDTSDVQRTAYANLARDFRGRVPFRLKGGLHVRQSARDSRSPTAVYTFLGPDGNAATEESAAPFRDPVYGERRGVFGLPPIQGTSPFLAWQHYHAHPDQFALDENGQYRTTVSTSKFAEELVSSAYLRGDVSLFAQRLKLVGGVRVEQTNIDAQGPLTDPAGNYQKDSAGETVLVGGRPVPIVANTNSLAYSQLTFIERGFRAEKEYLRLFPSLNASFSVRENLIARVGLYRSVGRPDFNQYAGGLTLPDPESIPSQNNRIVVNNVGIKAWSANTANVRLEYYFAGVGQISINAFRRDFENFFGATRFPATPEFLALYDVDAVTYGDFDVETQYNVPGTVRMEGSSLNYKQALTFLPPWARGVQVFANYSTQRRTGALVGDSGFPFYPRTGNWGVSLTREKFQARINWNYRSARRGAAVTGASIGPDTYNWVPRQVTYDVQLDYYFYRRFAVFGSLRNAGEIPADTHIYGPLTPEPARFRNRIDWGSLWTFGVKGTF